jgi:hypothetical protein
VTESGTGGSWTAGVGAAAGVEAGAEAGAELGACELVTGGPGRRPGCVSGLSAAGAVPTDGAPRFGFAAGVA